MPKAKVLLLLLLILGTSISGICQKTIKGTVTDATSGQTLPATNILIEGTYRGTITNENGEYTLAIPDSLLPATLVVRYIGYHTREKEITASSPGRQNFALQPAVTQMDEITVTDENPAVRIMREVIRRKQQWRRKLDTYRAEAYTRQTLANDTSIVSISESVSEVFWDEQQGHREVLKSKRQTANLSADQNFAGVSYMPNFYDDNIEIAGFELVGVTHPRALDYYDFRLEGRTSLDNRTVYKIRVIPDKRLQPLFTGTVFVLEEAFALLEVDLKPNKVVSFPRPVKSFNLDYRQQFNNFGKQYWLPVDVRISGNIKISMIGLEFPLIKFKQISRITDYRVNVPLPDSLYRKEDLFAVDSATVTSDSLISKQVESVPLSTEEEKAYASLDSTATLEKAFKPTGPLARFIDDEEDEGGGSGPGFLSGIPGRLRPDARYNRVEEVFGGLKYSIEAAGGLKLKANAGYNTGYKEWDYGGGAEFQWLGRGPFESAVGGAYSAGTVPRYTSHVYEPYFTIIPNLTGNDGYFDYHRSEGYRLYSVWRQPDTDLSLTAGFNSFDHTSLSTNTAYDLLGTSGNYRLNPPIDEGRLRSIDLEAGYNLNENYNFGITGRKYVRFELEHSSGALGSDFNFTRYETRISWVFPTFYQRRLLPNTLDIGLKAGTWSGDLPFQKLGFIDGAIGVLSPYGVLRAARGHPYEGEQYLALHAEHNFRTIPFEVLGIQPLVERNIGLILFGGAARTWGPDWSAREIALHEGYQPHGTEGIHWEAGVSINGILGLFRLDLAARLDEPALLVNLGVARLF